MQFQEITMEEFDEFSQHVTYTNFWQSINMAGLREWNQWKTKYVGVKESDKLIAACFLSYREVFLHGTFVQAPRGFLLDYTNLALLDFFNKQLQLYLRGLNCMYFKMDPYLSRIERDENGDILPNGISNEYIVEHLKTLGYQHAGYLCGNDDTREPNWMFVLSLKGKTEEQLIKEFDQQTRWSINKTIKQGIEVKEVGIEQLDLFKDIMEHTAKRRGFADHDRHYYEGLFQNFQQKGKMKALVAQLDLNTYEERLTSDHNRIQQELHEVEEALVAVVNSRKFTKKKKVLLEDLELCEKKLAEAAVLKKESKDGVLTLAGATFILYGKEVMYLYSGAYEQYMKMNAPYALQWYIIRYALAHGYERYNFYGISGIFEKSADDYGIYEFKKGFTGNVEELVGDFTLVMQPMKYRLYELLRQLRNKLRGRK